jgi:hypothetical protein
MSHTQMFHGIRISLMHACIHTLSYMHAFTHALENLVHDVYMYVHINTLLGAQECFSYTRTFTCECIHTYIHTNLEEHSPLLARLANEPFPYTHSQVHAYIHTCMRTFTHTCIHTLKNIVHCSPGWPKNLLCGLTMNLIPEASTSVKMHVW